MSEIDYDKLWEDMKEKMMKLEGTNLINILTSKSRSLERNIIYLMKKDFQGLRK